MAKSIADSLFEGQDEPPLPGDAVTPDVSLETTSTPTTPVEPPADPTPAIPATTAATGELATPSTPAVPPAAPALSPFMQKVTELGFENVKDENEARDRLLQSYEIAEQQRGTYEKQLREATALAQYGQQYLQQQQDPAYQQFLAQRQPQTPTAPKDENWWAPPKFDPQWVDQWRELDPATGQHKWKDGTPADVRSNGEAYQGYVQKWQHDILTNPVEALQKHDESLIRQMEARLEEKLAGMTHQQEVLSFADQIKKENADWLFAKDPRTQQPLINPADGQAFYSQEGQRVMQYVQRAEQVGISDAREQWSYAMAMYNYETGKAAPTAPAAATPSPPVNPQQAVQESQLAMLKRNGQANQNRGGSVPGREEKARPQNQHQRPGIKLLEQLDRDGVAVG